jgi:hypothetical protein
MTIEQANKPTYLNINWLGNYGYSSIPIPNRKLDQKEFNQLMFNRGWMPDHYECHQLFMNSSQLWSCQFYWFTGYGLMIATYGSSVEFYRIGCEHHSLIGVTIGHCLTRYSCPECGFTETLDSSD